MVENDELIKASPSAMKYNGKLTSVKQNILNNSPKARCSNTISNRFNRNELFNFPLYPCSDWKKVLFCSEKLVLCARDACFPREKIRLCYHSVIEVSKVIWFYLQNATIWNYPRNWDRSKKENSIWGGCLQSASDLHSNGYYYAHTSVSPAVLNATF